MFRASRTIVCVIRFVSFALCFALILTSVPVSIRTNASGITQNNPQTVRRRSKIPGKDLPNLNATRNRKPDIPKAAKPDESTKCSRRDSQCRKIKEAKTKKTSLNASPSYDAFRGLIARLGNPFDFSGESLAWGLLTFASQAGCLSRYAAVDVVTRSNAGMTGVTSLQSGYTLTASPTSAASGAPLTAAWTAPSGRPATDWVGLYAAGASDAEMLDWQYTQGTTSGSLIFEAPWDNGNYEFRYFLEDGFTRVAVSNSMSITASNFEMERLDPANRIGNPGEDLFSSNYNWSLPILDLPGRAGLDLSLSLTYNSLVWTKGGCAIAFDSDIGFPAPGFRLGFPVIQNSFINSLAADTISYLMILPSGRRVGLRQTAANTYQAVDSSYLYLTVNPGAQTMTLFATDGTRMKFEPRNGVYQCTEIKDRHGNFITVTYKTFGAIDTITDTLARVVTFNYDGYNHLISITQNWNGTPRAWATFSYGNQLIYTKLRHQQRRGNGRSDISGRDEIQRVHHDHGVAARACQPHRKQRLGRNAEETHNARLDAG